MKCLTCLFWLLEKVLKYISKNAYILIAAWGCNFCTGAKESFNLITRNIIRVGVLNKVTDMIILLGELFVASIIVALEYYYLTGTFAFLDKVIPFSRILPIPRITYFWLPLVVTGVGSFVIALYCFSVFQMAIDTLFICALEDLEKNNGSPEKPYSMTAGLLRALQVKNS